eukprot:7854048-Alexandrium_andersonii.AAC.1
MAPILRGASSRFWPWLGPACREALATLRSLTFAPHCGILPRRFSVGRPRDSGLGSFVPVG